MKFKEIKPGMRIRCKTADDAMVLLEYLDSQGYKGAGDIKVTDMMYFSQDSGVCYHLGSDKYVTWNYGKYDDEITDFSDLVDYGPSIEGSLDSPEIHTGQLAIDEPKEVHIEGIIQEFYFSDSAKEPIGGEWVVNYDATDFQDGKHLWWKQRARLTDGCETETEPYYRGKCEDLREEVTPIDTPAEMTAERLLEALADYDEDDNWTDVFGEEVADCYEMLEKLSAKSIIQSITAYEAEKKKHVEVQHGFYCEYCDTEGKVIDTMTIFGGISNEYDISELRDHAKELVKKSGVPCIPKMFDIYRAL